MRINLLAMDIDGTILHSNGELPERNYCAIRAAADKGVHVVPVTGRVFRELPDSLIRIPEIRYVITSNGACIYDIMRNQQLHSDYMSIEDFKAVYSAVSEYHTFIECYRDGSSVITSSDFERLEHFRINPESIRFIRRYSKRVGDLQEYLRGLDNPKIEKLNIRAADKLVFQQLWNKLNGFTGLKITSAGWDCIEVNHKGVDKSEALRYLCSCIKVSSENVMAIGDGLNDKEMLNFAGLSVAMGNATGELLDIADHITEINDHDGAGIAIEKFILAQANVKAL